MPKIWNESKRFWKDLAGQAASVEWKWLKGVCPETLFSFPFQSLLLVQGDTCNLVAQRLIQHRDLSQFIVQVPDLWQSSLIMPAVPSFPHTLSKYICNTFLNVVVVSLIMSKDQLCHFLHPNARPEMCPPLTPQRKFSILSSGLFLTMTFCTFPLPIGRSEETNVILLLLLLC